MSIAKAWDEKLKRSTVLNYRQIREADLRALVDDALFLESVGRTVEEWERKTHEMLEVSIKDAWRQERDECVKIATAFLHTEPCGAVAAYSNGTVKRIVEAIRARGKS